MSLLLPASDSTVREAFEVADLAARRWDTFAASKAAALRMLKAQPAASRVFCLVIRADDEIQLVSFGPRGGHRVEWRFGKSYRMAA